MNRPTYGEGDSGEPRATFAIGIEASRGVRGDDMPLVRDP